MNDTHIGIKLKELRKARSLRQYEVAEAVGVSRAMISNLEAGRRSLTLETLKSFADFYQVSIEYFELSSGKDDLIDLMERTRKIFENNDISVDVKEELYIQVSELYLKLKKSSTQDGTTQ